MARFSLRWTTIGGPGQEDQFTGIRSWSPVLVRDPIRPPATDGSRQRAWPNNSLHRIRSGTAPRRRSLSQIRNSAEICPRRGASRNHDTWPPPFRAATRSDTNRVPEEPRSCRRGKQACSAYRNPVTTSTATTPQRPYLTFFEMQVAPRETVESPRRQPCVTASGRRTSGHAFPSPGPGPHPA